MPTLPKNILVPTDFGERAEVALAYALDLADRLDARVHVVHAIEVPELGVPELGIAVASARIDGQLRRADAAIEKLVARHRGHVSLGDVLLRTGDARAVTLQAAAELAADLIVIGTHGRRGLAHAVLGSRAEAIVRSAPCPVLTIGPTPQPQRFAGRAVC
jgi:nucleotide-binding universal stress UspA family protein